MTHRLVALLALLLSTTGCVSYPPDSPPEGYSQGSPKQSIDYLSWAYENKSPLHMSKALSIAFMDGQGISPTDMAVAWGEVENWVEESIGNVDEIQVSKPLFVAPNGRLQVVQVQTPQKRAKVTFVLESRYQFIPFDFFGDTAENDFTSMPEIMQYNQDTAVIKLPNVPTPGKFPPEKIHRIVIESAWRIDAIESDGKGYGNPIRFKTP